MSAACPEDNIKGSRSSQDSAAKKCPYRYDTISVHAIGTLNAQ